MCMIASQRTLQICCQMTRMSRHIPARRYYISQHRQVEARLLEELRDLGLLCGGAERPPRMLTPADVQKLAYLHCVIKVRPST